MRRNLLRKFSPIIPDRQFVKWMYKIETGKKLNLNNPVTMNEKLQWLKLYNRRPEYTTIVDKIDVKGYIAARIGAEYIVPTLAVWNSTNDIDLETLPQQFVLKTNHSGGNKGVIICKDKNSLNMEETINKLNKSLRTDLHRNYREWPYKNVKKRIFAEMYLGDDLVDYKFYCYNGSVDAVLLCIDRQAGSPKFYFFDREWNLKRYNKRGKEAPEGFTLPKPSNMEKMFELASELSKGIPFVRVDFYNVDGKIYFGEMTFFPASGYDTKRLPESDLLFGNMIDLSLAYNSAAVCQQR